jgi:hypothetical protein
MYSKAKASALEILILLKRGRTLTPKTQVILKLGWKLELTTT